MLQLTNHIMEECPNTCEHCIYQDIGCAFQVTRLFWVTSLATLVSFHSVLVANWRRKIHPQITRLQFLRVVEYKEKISFEALLGLLGDTGYLGKRINGIRDICRKNQQDKGYLGIFRDAEQKIDSYWNWLWNLLHTGYVGQTLSWQVILTPLASVISWCRYVRAVILFLCHYSDITSFLCRYVVWSQVHTWYT